MLITLKHVVVIMKGTSGLFQLNQLSLSTSTSINSEPQYDQISVKNITHYLVLSSYINSWA